MRCSYWCVNSTLVNICVGAYPVRFIAFHYNADAVEKTTLISWRLIKNMYLHSKLDLSCSHVVLGGV